MCEPVSITMGVGMAISAAMAMAQQAQAASNQRKMINARNDANLAEAERQEGFQKQTDTVFGDALSRYQGDAAANREAEATGKREDTLTDAAAGASGGPYNPSFGSSGGPQIVKSELARKTAQALSAGKDQAKALARLGGTKDFNFGNLIDLGRTGGQLKDIGALSTGSARLLPIEQQTAITNAYDPPSPWLEVGKQVGRGLQSYGAMGAPGLAASGAPMLGAAKGAGWAGNTYVGY